VHRWVKVLSVVGVVVAVSLVAALLAGTWTVRRPFPETSGELELPGLSADVDVVRDDHGIPQIYADTAEDLFQAQGFVHAQDRFFEMDFRRHVTSGRLAELFGPEAVETDAFVRTLGWRDVAERELALLDADSRRYLQAYADGVNAYLDDRSASQLSLEYSVLSLDGLDYAPEPWTIVDSLAWLKAIAWDLRGNMQDEIDRVLATQSLSTEQVEELYPDYPYERHPPIVDRGAVVDGSFEQDATANTTREPARAALSDSVVEALEGVSDAAADLPTLLGTGQGIGSNSWVVSGDHTNTGMPILANDPHLAPSIPGIWYQVGLHCRTVDEDCPFDVAGFSFSGFPGVVIGHNDSVAWGMTNLGADVVDLYLEKVDDASQTYRYDGEPHELETHRETISVAGGEDVEITVRRTRHGPLISDVDDRVADVADRRDASAVAIRWTALQPGPTANAVFGLNRARSWDEFRSAAADFEVPSQNLVYADVDGHIGYQAPGRIPIRRTGNGDWPVPGWDPAYEWVDEPVPFDALPSVLDPEGGVIATANQAVAGPAYPYYLGSSWSYGYRSQRITDLLADDKSLSVEDMADIQLDTRNGNAAQILAYLVDVNINRPYVRDGQEVLRHWDLEQQPDSAGAAYFNVVWQALLERTFHDELPEEVWPDGGSRWFEVVRGLLEEPNNAWWDDKTTDGRRENRDDILVAAMTDARYEITRLAAQDPSLWRWGHLHRLTLVHEPLGSSGAGALEAMFNRGPLEVGGGDSIVNATGWTAPEGFAVDWVPSMRMVVSLDDLDRSRWVNLTGASGHAFSSHYDDQLELWADGETLPWAFSAEAVEAAAEDTLTLTPAG